jgi:hypothetical protein
MSPSSPSRGQTTETGSGRATRPGGRSVRNVSLLMLVVVDVVVAIIMIAKLVGFVVSPDPSVKAGPMYVTLTLTTIAAVLMCFMALNASFLPFVTQQRARDLRLVMWATGVTGIVTGVLTVGKPVQSIMLPLFVGVIAFVFIRVQETRLQRARTNPPPAWQAAARQDPARERGTKSKQRRGGRKR